LFAAKLAGKGETVTNHHADSLMYSWLFVLLALYLFLFLLHPLSSTSTAAVTVCYHTCPISILSYLLSVDIPEPELLSAESSQPCVSTSPADHQS